MHSPDKATFLKKAEQGNLVPVWREVMADQETPVSIYQRLRFALVGSETDSATFLLESVEGGEHLARYSFIGSHPQAQFTAVGRNVWIDRPGEETMHFKDQEPLSVLKEYMARFKPVHDPALPRFFGGAVGFLGYDAVAQFERVPLAEENDLEWPDMIFSITGTLIVFDHVRHTMKIVANAFIQDDPDAAYDEATRRIDAMCASLSNPVPHHFLDVCEGPDEIEFKSNTEKEDFLESVRASKEYIRAGDVIQVVLSQRFETADQIEPLEAYRALRSVNPSPYMFCLEFGDRAMVGSSPEIHVRCEDGRVEVRPIAGTRPRSASPAEDRRLAEELLADPKERAEHIMLVDLGRNDIGRVCRYGSVHVPELMVIERYSHVMHIVSDVVGELADDHDAYDVMRATFPAGTVSGAPKIRAMEIIAEFERTRRGPYAGAVAYFGFDGNLDSCITIRTILIDGEKAYVQAGAGIVADSDPETEYLETCNKAKGMLKALAISKQYAAKRNEASS